MILCMQEDNISEDVAMLPALAFLNGDPASDVQSTFTTSHSTASSTSPSSYIASTQEEERYSSPSAPTFSDITCAEKVCYDSIALSVGSQEVEDHVRRADVNEVQATYSPVLLGYKVVGDNLDKNVKPRYR